MLVGAYLKHVEDCEIVAYGQQSPNTGEQMELDVIGFQPEGDQEIIACEVGTHICGLNMMIQTKTEIGLYPRAGF